MTTKALGIGLGITTGVTGVAGAVAFSAGAFNSDSNTQISKLLEDENKFTLLPTSGDSNSAEWDEAWNKYKQDNLNKKNGQDKWGLSTAGKQLDTMPTNFKTICEQKSKELVKDKSDSKYLDITNYCSRPKTLQEALSKEGVTNLLSTDDSGNKEQEWTTRYGRYKNSNNKLPEATGVTSDDFKKLRASCKEATKLKTTEAKYSEIHSAFKEWCLE